MMAGLVEYQCLNCGKTRHGHRHHSTHKYCNNTCRHAYTNRIYIERWLEGLETGRSGKTGALVSIVKRWLIETRGECCERCGWNERHPTTGRVPIQVDHVDGNWLDCSPSNLCLLCPNCHSLTLTYGALNKGNGRKLNRAGIAQW